ncbi:MAG: type II toxin-antitoxin system HicB family antitoxin [Chloroflexi bacterium]|nr:type II toxin-antitoxin system HicB family antitoxin [Chloroflexota bacterium]
MRLPYRAEIYWDEDYWAAEFPELPGLAAGSETWEGLATAIEDAKRVYFESALERHLPIPEPGQRPAAYSGRVLLRLPKSLHAQAARAAEQDGVSINSFLVSAVARELGRVSETR